MRKTEERARLEKARRIVVKIGTRVLVQRTGRPDVRRMQALVKDLARLRRAGHDVVVVSSGAIGAGMQALGLSNRPNNLPDLQMAAAVGQNRLMAQYDKLFSKERCTIGQVLLTHDGLNDRKRHLNIRGTMMSMLRHGIIPIVNENDVVAVDEIKVGDNDVLASLVALLIGADTMVLLTTADGLRGPTKSGRTRRIPYLEAVTKDTLKLVFGKGSDLSTGGMGSKLEAAQMAVDAGIAAVIADGTKAQVLENIFSGEDVGTLIGSTEDQSTAYTGRKRWLAFFHRAAGSVFIDDGACKAIEEKGKSLLPIGIKKVENDFPVGALVNVRDRQGRLVARGLAEYSSAQIRKIKGRRTSEIAALLGSKDYDEVIHRDNMVLMNGGKGELS